MARKWLPLGVSAVKHAIAGITYHALTPRKATVYQIRLLCIIIRVLCRKAVRVRARAKLASLTPDPRLISIFPNVIKLSAKVTCRLAIYIRAANGMEKPANHNRARAASTAPGNFRKTFESGESTSQGTGISARVNAPGEKVRFSLVKYQSSARVYLLFSFIDAYD